MSTEDTLCCLANLQIAAHILVLLSQRYTKNGPETPHHKALHAVLLLLWYCECCTLKAIHEFRDNDSVELTDLGLSLDLTLVPQDSS